MQYNYVSTNQYHGKNLVELTQVQKRENYKTGLWLTFLQARELGLSIKKGSKSTPVFNGVREDEENNKIFCGYSMVFNIEQTDCPEDQFISDYKQFKKELQTA